MDTPDFDDPIYAIRPSVPRRFIGLGVQFALGILLIYIAFSENPSMTWRLFLIVLGGLALANATRSWRATQGAIVLRADGLFEEDGTPIAKLDDIAKVDRALFANKPSNGFVVRMKTSQPRGWAPGMWWRFGKRVGIGGVTSGAQTKIVADALSMMVAQRDSDQDT